MPSRTSSPTQADRCLFGVENGVQLFKNKSQLSAQVSRLTKGAIQPESLVRNIGVALQSGAFEPDLRALVLRAAFEQLKGHPAHYRDARLEELRKVLVASVCNVRKRGRPGVLSTCDQGFLELFLRYKRASSVLVSGIGARELTDPHTIMLRKLMQVRLGLARNSAEEWEEIAGYHRALESAPPTDTKYRISFTDKVGAHAFLEDLFIECVQNGPFEGMDHQRMRKVADHIVQLEVDSLRVYVDSSDSVLFPIIGLDPDGPDTSAFTVFSAEGKLSLCEVVGPAFDRWRTRAYLPVKADMEVADEASNTSGISGQLQRIRMVDVPAISKLVNR